MSSKAARPGWINWRSSEAQGILLEDLIQGTLPEELSAEQAWDVYKDRLEFSGVVFQQFKERLRDHRKQVKNNPGPSGSKQKRNEVNPDFIKWEKSEPRAILIEDLVQGVLPLDDKEMTHETAWNILYKDMKEFSEVCFAQFKARLRDHRKQVKQGLLRSKHEEECMERDRRLFPRKESNGDGKPNFDLHPAKLLLRADVKNKKHKQMKPSKLRMSRPEYQAFDNDHFRQRIHQASRREKFVNWLEHKRKEKKLDASNIKRLKNSGEADHLRMKRQQQNANKRRHTHADRSVH